MNDYYSTSDDFFKYWISSVVVSLQFITDMDMVRNVWIFGAQDVTSIYSIDELFEQLLGDLHLQDEIIQFEDRLRRLGVLGQITAFVNRLVSLEKEIKDDPRLEHPEALLASQAWQDLQASARSVVQVPSVREFAQ